MDDAQTNLAPRALWTAFGIARKQSGSAGTAEGAGGFDAQGVSREDS